MKIQLDLLDLLDLLFILSINIQFSSINSVEILTNSYLTHVTQCINSNLRPHLVALDGPCTKRRRGSTHPDTSHTQAGPHHHLDADGLPNLWYIWMETEVSILEKRWKTHGFFGFTWFFKSKNQQFLFVRWRWCFGLLVSERKWNAGSCRSVCRSMVFSGQTGICRSEIMASRLGNLHLSCACWCGCCYSVGWEDTCIMHVYKHIWLYRCFPKEQHVFLWLVAQIKPKTTWHTPAGCPFPCISCSTTSPRCSCCSCRDGWWGPRTSSSSIQGEATNW